MAPPNRVPPGPGQESVWDYPRPPRVEPVPERLRVEYQGVTVADTTQAFRVLETSHPPTYYIPPADVQMQHLTRTTTNGSVCEWKGRASYFDLAVNGKMSSNAAWCYTNPTSGFKDIDGYLCFYASKVDACYVGDEQVQAQQGDFYGGWITSKVVGPFKGGAGTWGW